MTKHIYQNKYMGNLKIGLLRDFSQQTIPKEKSDFLQNLQEHMGCLKIGLLRNFNSPTLITNIFIKIDARAVKKKTWIFKKFAEKFYKKGAYGLLKNCIFMKFQQQKFG